jgi:CRP/FNR family transcriptional regulator, cyclic AMP receptor protein
MRKWVEAIRQPGKTRMRNLIEAITKYPIFGGMKPEHRAILGQDATGIEFKSGDVVFREGDPANRFYLIESGGIILEAHEPPSGTVAVESLAPGQVFGWSWLFPPFTWHFHARAAEPTRVIALNGARLLVTAEQNPEFGYELMKRMAQVVIRRLQASRRQLVAARMEPEMKA